jgi:hypothetical protein
MTAITRLEQEETDFDWFCADRDGHIGHFTTAGFKLLPQSVSASAEDLKRIADYFNQLQGICEYRIDDALIKQIGPFEDSAKERQYLSSFSRMASRGLYSFDIDPYVRPGLHYFRVAMPMSPIRLEVLPTEIRGIVGRTLMSTLCLQDTSQIDYNSTLTL